MMQAGATHGPRQACLRRLLKPKHATGHLRRVTIVSWALLLMPTRPVEAAPFTSGVALGSAVDNCLAADSTGACD
eukprot:5624416-Ditylum_brightwellii.AAC.1